MSTNDTERPSMCNAQHAEQIKAELELEFHRLKKQLRRVTREVDRKAVIARLKETKQALRAYAS
jgi:hypothetical protein